MQLTTQTMFATTAAMGLALLGSCNYFPSTTPTGGSSSGSVSFAMTDAASDEIDSFLVDVTGLQIKKSDGTVVSVISAPVTVDLASLTDTTQLLNLASLPAAVYNSATITLDFTHAVCLLIGQSSPASILDDNGTPVTGTLSLPIQFDQGALSLLGNTHRMLEFDFDLNQSVEVNSSTNSVVLEPAFALHVDGSGKQLLTFGTLVSADSSNSTFVGDVTTLAGVAFGNETFATDANTVFQVDGVPATGSSGLASLGAKSAGTWIQVYGAIDPNSAKINAHYVEAGAGTYNGGTDIIEGHVIDRVSNPPAGSNVTLVVLGRSNNSSHTVFQYDTMFNVTTNFAATKVVRFGSAQAFDSDDLNVGQRVRVFGTLSGTAMNASTPTSVVREQPARAFGIATAAITGSTLTLDLHHIDLVPQASFTWADSGSGPPNPSLFTVNAGTLGTGLGIITGTAVEARGFLAPIADVNQDMTATALINLANAPSFVFVKDMPAGMTVVLTMTGSQIQVAMSGTPGPAEEAIVDHGFAGVQSLPASPTPIIQPATVAGPFMLRDKTTGNVTAFVTFDAFTTALGGVLAQGASLRTLGGVGQYDSTTNSLQATSVSVVVE
jgi:hypothetical protein